MEPYQNDPSQNGNQNNNFNGFNGSNEYKNNAPAKPNGFVNASMTCGILSIITSFVCPIYLPFVFGGLGILFALLSRKGNEPLHPNAKAGLITGILGVVLYLVILIVSCVTVFNDPNYKDQLNSVSEQLYGESFDDMIEDLEGVN